MEAVFRTNAIRILFELGSDFFREAAVLVVVFGLLEKIMKEQPIGFHYTAAIVSTGLLLFMIGYWLQWLGRRK